MQSANSAGICQCDCDRIRDVCWRWWLRESALRRDGQLHLTLCRLPISRDGAFDRCWREF
jgi:hypothetical protein